VRLTIAVFAGLAAAVTGFGYRIDTFQPGNITVLPDTFKSVTFVCAVERPAKLADPCSEQEETCEKASPFAVKDYSLPETAEKSRRGCETHDDMHVALVLPNLITGALPVQRQSEAPELPSFLLVGAGLLLLRFPFRLHR